MPDRDLITLLVVDNDPASRHSLCTLLQAAGFALVEASTGAEALQRAADRPDMILLVIPLPDIDASELFRRLKADPATQSIPILHLCATRNMIGEQIAGLDGGGAVGYLIRSVDPAILLATIQALLRDSQAEEALRQAHSALEAKVQERTADLSAANAALRREIAERKRAEAQVRQMNAELEARVQERTAQLETANEALESFINTLSHDLRSPLRAIEGFAEMLCEDYPTELTPEAQHCLERIQDSVGKMSGMIDGLLTLSRLSRQSLHRKSVDPAKVSCKVLAELETERQGRSVDVRIDDLPPCQADPDLLKQVLWHLLANSLKFTRPRETAVVEIGCVPGTEAEAPVYFVKDNGIGFDLSRAHKLFGVFQRLQSTQKFEGIGAGLAIVQRIVQRHGGRIWAEAQPDCGATFYFTLQESARPAPALPGADAQGREDAARPERERSTSSMDLG